MAWGTNIIVSEKPKGVFREGIGSGTLYPGMIVEKTSTAPSGGRFTYQARSTTAGSKGAIAVVLGSQGVAGLLGFLGVGAALSPGGNAVGDSISSGERISIYYPVAGEDLNLVVGSVAGTADDVAIGAKFGVNNDGKLKADSSYTSCPFESNETITDPTTDYLLWVTYMGNNA